MNIALLTIIIEVVCIELRTKLKFKKQVQKLLY